MNAKPIQPPVRLILDHADKQSSLWLKLAEHITERIGRLQRELEGPLAPEETANRRGRIAELRALLALEKDPPPLS